VCSSNKILVLQAEIYNARLQLVILSPLLLSWVLQHPSQLPGRLLQQDRVIAILLGVTEEQVTPEHRYNNKDKNRISAYYLFNRKHLDCLAFLLLTP
jgi:hypothetical protein